MPLQSRASVDFTLDVSTQLKDAGAVTSSAAAQVGGADRVLDFGNITTGPAVELVAYTSAWLVIDVLSIDRTTADEFYDLVFQLSTGTNDVGFEAGDTVVPKAVIHLGEELGPDGDADAGTATGRIAILVDNERLGTVFRFARMAHVVGGTTPIINYTAFLSPVS